jgi:hypothetical protein
MRSMMTVWSGLIAPRRWSSFGESHPDEPSSRYGPCEAHAGTALASRR